jgi:AP-1-like transcription factor
MLTEIVKQGSIAFVRPFRYLFSSYCHLRPPNLDSTMAGNSGNQFTPPSYLTPNQQDLLMAALASNNHNRKQSPSLSNANGFSQSASASWDMNGHLGGDGLDPLMYAPTQPTLPMAGFDNLDGNLNESPFLDLLDNSDANFDFDLPEGDGQMIDGLPETGNEGDYDMHDKRKSPEDDNEDKDENEAKRTAPDEKVAKKPGRKPLTSEPTSVSCCVYTSSGAFLTRVQKRKAQNRAAQRAFRERKEKHLKDLETKVAELEKASESANHENGLLRAQVERLQMELREYRKRLSLGASTLGRSPPLNNGLSSYLATAASGGASNFQFEFPRFGSLPGGVGGVFNNGTLNKPTSPPVTNGSSSVISNAVPGVLSRHDSNGQTASPRSQSRPNGSISAAGSPPKNGSISGANGSVQIESINNDGLAGLFSSSMLNASATTTSTNLSSSTSTPANTEQVNPQARIFQFNSSNSNSSGSPESSSVSQYGGNSSCGTSPEPSHNSPANGNKDMTLDTINEQGYICRSGSDGEITFCEKLNMACGNPRNPIPRALSMSKSNGASATNAAANPTSTPADAANKAATTDDNSFHWLAQQNGGQFDPMLFGDYRDSQSAIVGDGDFTGGFFNDALPATADYSSPFNWDLGVTGTGLTPAIQKPNPLEQADLLQAGADEEEVVPGEDRSKMLTCHKIWYEPHSLAKLGMAC